MGVTTKKVLSESERKTFKEQWLAQGYSVSMMEVYWKMSRRTLSRLAHTYGYGDKVAPYQGRRGDVIPGKTMDWPEDMGRFEDHPKAAPPGNPGNALKAAQRFVR